MADTKITSLLTPQVTTNPATDVLPIVNIADTSMAASGSTRKITVNQLLGAGGTATLASATISGDLTVDTSTLYVSSSADKVGIGTTSLSNEKLTVAGNISANAWIGRSNIAAPAGDCSIFRSADNTLGFGIASTTAMTLNSTGLGLGVSPSYKLDVLGSVRIGTTNPLVRLETGTNTGFVDYNDTRLQLHAGPLPIYFVAGNTLKMTLDSSGNVGIGVTPSAWGSNYKSIDLVGGGRVFTVSGTGTHGFSFNAFNNNTNWLYQFTTVASRFELQQSGNFAWLTAPSGTAGNAITFTQAMTLAATGQLLLGTSSTNGAVDIGMVMNKPSATGFVGNVYQLNGVDKAFAYIASAASAYTTETVSGYIIRAVSATNGVYLPNGGTSWLALSDERFKDIIEPISNAVAKVGSLRSVIGKFKTESEGTRRSFLIAQDVQAVLPEAVDASNPDQLGVAYTEVIPLLVAAIKELATRVQTLEAK